MLCVSEHRSQVEPLKASLSLPPSTPRRLVADTSLQSCVLTGSCNSSGRCECEPCHCRPRPAGGERVRSAARVWLRSYSRTGHTGALQKRDLEESHRNRALPPPGALTMAAGTEVRKGRRVTICPSPQIDSVRAGGGGGVGYGPRGVQKQSSVFIKPEQRGVDPGNLDEALRPGNVVGIFGREIQVAPWLQVEGPGWLGHWLWSLGVTIS